MTIISGVKAFIATYTGLASGAPLGVDHLDSQPPGYAIIPTPGTKVVELYLNAGSLRVYPFAFQSMEITADEAERLENSGFFESFSDWLDMQTKAGVLPTLGTGQTATAIQAVSWAFIYQSGESATAVYRIQCQMTYLQEPPPAPAPAPEPEEVEGDDEPEESEE